jgi:hypothetical protein
MKITRKAIPYIYYGAGILIAATLALAGCADTGSSRAPSSELSASDNDQRLACKSAIDDVTRYCSGDNASTGKCNDAKSRTRQHCITD